MHDYTVKGRLSRRWSVAALECGRLPCTLHGSCTALPRTPGLLDIGQLNWALPRAPEGPSVSSRRFQPAEGGGNQITPTLKGLTFGASVRPLQGRGRFSLLPPWVPPTATHGLPLRGKVSCAGPRTGTPRYRDPYKEQSLPPLWLREPARSQLGLERGSGQRAGLK
jgi:hypothetical protein